MAADVGASRGIDYGRQHVAVQPGGKPVMERKGLETYDQLRRAALEQTGVSFCTRLHFGRALPGEERRYVRLAYSGISAELIREGLGRLKEWAR
jgi:aspartate/methionine/tyrosine aminotransferase